MSQADLHNPKAETMPRDEIEQLQVERLQSTLNRVYRNVAFYRGAFDSHCVDLEKIKDLRALAGLPFTTKADLQRSYPYDMFAVPLRDIVRIHSSPGLAGRPVVVGYTRNDLRNWTECTARLLTAAGITEHDVVQIALDYSLFAGGFGFQQGAEQVGASVIPASMSTSLDKQIAIMRDFKTTALIATPGHAAGLAGSIEKMRLHPEQLHLKLGVFAGERWNESLRGELERRLHIRAFDSYGLTDVFGPGVAGECPLRHGLHINEDHVIAEIINPKTLQPVAPGLEGELVLTTITREGFPLIRYRTGDVTSLNVEPCSCGRTFARIARVVRRCDDLIVLRGMGFYLSQIEEVLVEIAGAGPHYQIILDRVDGAETLEIKVEVSDQFPSLDEPKTLGGLRLQICRRIKTDLDLDAVVTFVEPRSLRHVVESSDRVLDRRGEPMP